MFLSPIAMASWRALTNTSQQATGLAQSALGSVTGSQADKVSPLTCTHTARPPLTQAPEPSRAKESRSRRPRRPLSRRRQHRRLLRQRPGRSSQRPQPPAGIMEPDRRRQQRGHRRRAGARGLAQSWRAAERRRQGPGGAGPGQRSWQGH